MPSGKLYRLYCARNYLIWTFMCLDNARESYPNLSPSEKADVDKRALEEKYIREKNIKERKPDDPEYAEYVMDLKYKRAADAYSDYARGISDTKPTYITSFFGGDPYEKLIQIEKARLAEKKAKKKAMDAIPLTRKEMTLESVLKCKDVEFAYDTYCKKYKCTCKYRDWDYEEIVLEYNKEILKDYFSTHEHSDYDDNLLEREWTYPTRENNFMSRQEQNFRYFIIRYIINCRFIYNIRKLKTDLWKSNWSVSKTFDCPNRIPAMRPKKNPSKSIWCERMNIGKNKDIQYCFCLFGGMTIIALSKELFREQIREKLIRDFNVKFTTWDKTVLTWDWSKASYKQNTCILKFLKRYKNLTTALMNHLNETIGERLDLRSISKSYFKTGGYNVKSGDGKLGHLVSDNASCQYKIRIFNSGEELNFNSVDEMIEAGWVVDLPKTIRNA